jgi:WhiB family transcriptional regulator, redox-sensing transcriptional regulator
MLRGYPLPYGPYRRRGPVRECGFAGVGAMPQGGSTVDWEQDWSRRAACKGANPDELFVQGAAQNRAKLVCQGCPVRTECLADALDNRVEFGVWGGMTERERRALLRRRPQVTSWRALLSAARDQYETGLREAAESMPKAG